MKRVAVIVVGSNSTRMLAADVSPALAHSKRWRISSRLFLHMNGRNLSPETIRSTAQDIATLCREAALDRAEVLYVCATSAVRDALNAQALQDAIFSASGQPLRILSGEEEALYSFYGVAGSSACGIIDLGGGSTEVAIGSGMQIHRSVSLQLGASRLMQTNPIHSSADVALAIAAADRATGQLSSSFCAEAAALPFYLLGGTGTTAAGMMKAEKIEGAVLLLDDVCSLLTLIAATPREARTSLPGFPASRVDIFPTGLAALISIMRRLNLKQVQVSEHTNCEGLVRAFVQKNLQGTFCFPWAH